MYLHCRQDTVFLNATLQQLYTKVCSGAAPRITSCQINHVCVQ